MNRLILIGNGFDLAHGLKTSYKDFIDWYWSGVLDQLKDCKDSKWSDELCSFRTKGGLLLCDVCSNININNNAYNTIDYLKKKEVDLEKESPLINKICESFETKGWADIESEYYNLLFKCGDSYPATIKVADLNKHMGFLQGKLVDYLTDVENNNIVRNEEINKKIYAPFNGRDISQVDFKLIREDIKCCCSDKGFSEVREQLNFYVNKGLVDSTKHNEYIDEGLEYKKEPSSRDEYPFIFRLPNNVMLLSFNYTKTADLYIPKNDGRFSVNYIHGKLDNPESVIFGYGDELDEKYKQLQESNDNECLKNVKSIKYLESDNYRKVLQFIESAPFQVCIMGHSCGNSDRTLLNTIFEHENCISIKPYYYYKRSDGSDNYIEIVQNISRNFKGPKLMRDRVVNKHYCEPLT